MMTMTTNSNRKTISNSQRKKVNQGSNSNNSPSMIKSSSDFTINQERLSLTDEEDGKKLSEGTIVARIDNIYLSIKDKPKYYTRLRILIFLIAVFNCSFLWIMLNMISPMKNNYYCFDPFSSEFKICDQDSFCDNTHYGINYIVFTSNTTLSNQDVLQELYNVNKLFLDYFLKDGITYSLANAKVNKYEEIDAYYSIVIAMTTYEKWNFFNFFMQYCNRQVLLVQMGVFVIIGLITGNLLFGYFADIYGRKKTLIALCLIQFFGSVIVFVVCLLILDGLNPSTSFESIYKSFLFDYTKDTNITTYINESKMDAFSSQNINNIYKSNFNDNIQMLIDAQVMNNSFSKFKIFLYLGLFLIFSGCSASSNISMAYILENSVNDTDIYSNYLFFHYSIPVSFLLQFILLTLINNFHVPFLIDGACLFILAILLMIFGWESPRYHYEYYEYKEITKLFENILDHELIRKFYKSEDIPKFRRELRKQNYNIGTCEVLCNKIWFLGYKQRFKKYREMIYRNNFREINRHEFIRSPYLLLMLISNDKYIKQNILIAISLTAIVGLIFFLSIIKFNLTLVFSRSDLYTNIIVNTVVFYQVIVMFISMAFFNFILKFFGFNIILFISFSMIFLFSLTFELLSFGSRQPEDMNAYIFNSIEIIYEAHGSSLIGILFVVNFFATGVFTCVYFYLTKLTKTLFRCTFYGIFHCIFDVTTFFSLALSQYFEKNFFYVAVLSVIGFVNAYFIKEDFDFTIIGDYRKIELEDDD